MSINLKTPSRFKLKISEIRQWLKSYRIITIDDDTQGTNAHEPAKLDKSQIDDLIQRWRDMIGYNKNRLAMLMDPDVDAFFPYVQFSSISDGRSCDLCSTLNGKIIDKKDPRLIAFIPPLHLGCRCTIVSVDKYDIAEKNIKPNWPADIQEPDWRIVTE